MTGRLGPAKVDQQKAQRNTRKREREREREKERERAIRAPTTWFEPQWVHTSTVRHCRTQQFNNANVNPSVSPTDGSMCPNGTPFRNFPTFCNVYTISELFNLKASWIFWFGLPPGGDRARSLSRTSLEGTRMAHPKALWNPHLVFFGGGDQATPTAAP